ncbi:MAG TPA: T9SS type A sorting domain-containing protein, partial [Saprospiraceae bacterium]|nr:T9SS type A sorting domain-containing protein [Saprospiraceae bacterium]
MTRDTGAEWKTITFNLPSNAGGIEYISVKHDDPNTAWVALSGYGVPGVYQYSALDSTWTNISSGLPPIPVYCVIENKQSTKELQLFAGTELGIYLKRGDRDWIPYTNGLPNVRVGEIEMYYAAHPGDSRLRAATYGRGLWESPVPAAPESGFAVSNAPVCFGQSAALNLAEYFGDIQWQQSADGVSGWENVTTGSGANDPDYQTDGLTSTLYYRAEVSQPEFEPQYSNVIEIPILPLPDDAGPISGIDTLCEGSQGILFSIDSVANATSYTWTLPDGVSGTSTSDSITVDFAEAKGNIEIQVHAKSGECDGGSSALIVTVMPNPVAPLADSILQPTCTVPTGIVHLTNLPDSGTWVMTNLVDSSSFTGEGNTYDLVDLLPGLYYYGITNAQGCSSGSSGAMVVLPQPVTPPTPTITVNEYVLHSDAANGNQWYDDNGPISGATGQDYTATSGGHYYVIVTLNGCSSPASNTIELFNESIDPGPHATSISIFPNPVKEEMHIKVNGISGLLNYSVINSLGQVVSHGSMTHETMVNTSSFSPGLYL